MKNLVLIIAVVLLGSMSSCEETKKVIGVAGSVQLSGNYMVTDITGAPDKISKEGDPLTINFAALDRSIRGNTGCNTYFGTYTIDLYALSFSDIGATERACSEPVMAKESAFMMALGNTGSYELQNNILTLFSKTDRSVLLTAKKEVQE
ncbi:META domain-containing protein [Jejudonia soesokkakensis]|uniref:META domain-containing protein n=1 Tax=Jejudonia soesokkakensis TaxID=1323432 RepID=A0ABW2MRK2_9FLAO